MPLPFKVLFSDLDGTCVHYPDQHDVEFFHDAALDKWHAAMKGVGGTEVILLPPSSTGAQGAISHETVRLFGVIRSMGVRLVLISGCRVSTLMQRLPYLPAADAFVCESGGRIFYPSPTETTGSDVSEDMEWRGRHTAAGPPGQENIAPAARQGILWQQYAALSAAGASLDFKNYTTAFRIRNFAQGSFSPEHDLLSGLAAASNLGTVDIFPATSGKLNAAAYLMTKFQAGSLARDARFMCGMCGFFAILNPKKTLNAFLQMHRHLNLLHGSINASQSHADDDNDVQLARAVGKAYLPMISSKSIETAVHAKPEHFVVATKPHVFAAEEILDKILQDLVGQVS